MDGAALSARTGHATTTMRCGVVDLGSNSVRLVVFEGRGRNPVAIFNEKAVLGLGRGLHDTGQLNPDAVAQALTIMQRYHAVARAMGAAPIEVLATAAVRDASNGAAFVAALGEKLPNVPIHILTGVEEARLSADGVLLGFPGADGLLGDIGGGSLELVALSQGAQGKSASLPIGTIRLADRAKEDIGKARAIVTEELARHPWLHGAAGRDLYLVGGAWRAMARTSSPTRISSFDSRISAACLKFARMPNMGPPGLEPRRRRRQLEPRKRPRRYLRRTWTTASMSLPRRA